MKFRFYCFGKNKENTQIALSSKTIGYVSQKVLSQISDGDVFFLYLSSEIIGIARVVGQGYTSDEVIWPDKLYPYRFKIEVIKTLDTPLKFLKSNGRQRIFEKYGSGWGYKFLYSPQVIPNDIALEILKDLGVEKTGSAPIQLDQDHFQS